MNSSKKRSLIIFAALEVCLLTAASLVVFFSFPEYLKHAWAILLALAALTALAYEGSQYLLTKKRARSYSRVFDLKDSLKRQIDDQPDELEQSLQSEEILEQFVAEGRRQLKQDHFIEAQSSFARAISLDPHQSRLYNYLGLALGRDQKHTEAVEAYNKAINIDYDFCIAHFNLALAYEELDRLDEALDEWHRFVEIGELVGEREEMIELARKRVRELGGAQNE